MEVGLVLKSHNDKDFKQWVNDYAPGWAWYVDEYGSPFIEWTKQNLFQRGKEPLSSDKPVSVAKLSSVEIVKDAKQHPKNTEQPTIAQDNSSASVSQSTPTVVQNKETTTASDDKSGQEIKGKVKENAKQIEPTKPLETKDDKVALVEKSEREKKSTELENPAKDVEQNSEEQTISPEIESSLANCLKEFTDTCGSVVESNMLLAESMEKERYNMAKELLHRSQDDGTFLEMKKSAENTAASLKAKVEESYPSYCAAHQKLLAVISEATSAGLASQVSEAELRIFEQTSMIQSSEDIVRRNNSINNAFDNFRNTLKLTEDEMGQELAELESSSSIDPSVVESVVLQLAERKVKLLHEKLQQLSVDGGKNLDESLQHYREELIKTFEAKMMRAMEESRTDMQARTEAKVSVCCSELYTSYPLLSLKRLERNLNLSYLNSCAGKL